MHVMQQRGANRDPRNKMEWLTAEFAPQQRSSQNISARVVRTCIYYIRYVCMLICYGAESWKLLLKLIKNYPAMLQIDQNWRWNI